MYQKAGGGLGNGEGHEKAEGGPAPGESVGPPPAEKGPHYGVVVTINKIFL